jgi:hypothetical protein
MDNEILESFNCPICLDVCNDPVESSCCKNLYCLDCSNSLNSECSFCRKRCRFERSILAKRLIDKLPLTCEYCKLKTCRGNLRSHYNSCEEFPISCPVDACDLDKIPKSKIMDHLIQRHKNEVIKRLPEILDVFNNSARVISSQASLSQSQSLPLLKTGSTPQSFNSLNAETTISIDAKTNSKGYVARIGETGKYYCGKDLDRVDCRCCNGSCGPTNGCNCSACMQLDLNSRILPKGWLVNREGFPSKKGSTGQFYCGRCVMRNIPNCDGYCGPDNGPNCDSCKKLDVLAKNRYSNLI